MREKFIVTNDTELARITKNRSQAYNELRTLENNANKDDFKLACFYYYIGMTFKNEYEITKNIGAIQQACSNYSKAIEKNPSDPTYFINRAETLIALKQWDAAQKDLDKAKSFHCNKPFFEVSNTFMILQLGKIIKENTLHAAIKDEKVSSSRLAP